MNNREKEREELLAVGGFDPEDDGDFYDGWDHEDELYCLVCGQAESECRCDHEEVDDALYNSQGDIGKL